MAVTCIHTNTGWTSVLRTDPTKWLLENTNPSVRYFTLHNLLDKPQDDPEVVLTREQIMHMPPVRRILNSQKPGGYWGDPQKFYVDAKWRGTFFTLILLAELGADGNDGRIQKACEFILANSQVENSGGFAAKGNPHGVGGMPKGEHPCMTGKMIWALIRFGYLNDARIQQGIDWIVTYQRFDDGEQKRPPEGWPYSWRGCWGKHTCFRGVVKNLKALAEIPKDRRSERVTQTIKKASEFILTHQVYRRSHRPDEVIRAEWQQFIFPQFGDIDVLEILLILTALGYRDSRMQDAINFVISKQNEQSRWPLERSYHGRMRASLEREGQPSKWITLRAMTLLKRFYGQATSNTGILEKGPGKIFT